MSVGNFSSYIDSYVELVLSAPNFGDRKFRFFLLENLSSGVAVGRDFLKKLGILVNPESNRLFFPSIKQDLAKFKPFKLDSVSMREFSVD